MELNVAKYILFFIPGREFVGGSSGPAWLCGCDIGAAEGWWLLIPHLYTCVIQTSLS